MNQQPATQLRAAIYERVSSDEQTRGYGLEYQREDCRRAITQHGHKLVEVYSDPGVSGTIEHRPGLERLREDGRQGKFDIVYFWKSDRLARDEILQLTLYREFRNLGIETYSVSEPNMNDLMRGIYAVFGAEDLRNLKTKMYSGRIRAWKDGKWIGATPFGYTKDANNRLQVYQPEATWVRTMFEWFVRDRMTIHGLVRRAFENGIPTRWDGRGRQKPRNGTCFWSTGTLTRLLSREYYATGTITVRPKASRVMGHTETAADEEIGIPAPPVISQELFDAAQEQLKHNHTYARRRSQRVYLFSNKLRCGICRRGLAGEARPGRADRKMYKGNRNSVQVRCAACRYYPEAALDHAIWPQIRALFDNPILFLAELEAYRNRNSRTGELEEEAKTLVDLEAKIGRQEETLLEYDLEGFYSASILVKKRTELTNLRQQVAQRRVDLERRLRAETEVRATVADVEHLYQRIRAVLDDSDYDTRAIVYKWLIDRIVLTGRHAEVWVTIPTESSSPSTTSGSSETDGVMSGPGEATQFIGEVRTRSSTGGALRSSYKTSVSIPSDQVRVSENARQAERAGTIISYFFPSGLRKGSLIVFSVKLDSSSRSNNEVKVAA